MSKACFMNNLRLFSYRLHDNSREWKIPFTNCSQYSHPKCKLIMEAVNYSISSKLLDFIDIVRRHETAWVKGEKPRITRKPLGWRAKYEEKSQFNQSNSIKFSTKFTAHKSYRLFMQQNANCPFSKFRLFIIDDEFFVLFDLRVSVVY